MVLEVIRYWKKKHLVDNQQRLISNNIQLLNNTHFQWSLHEVGRNGMVVSMSVVAQLANLWTIERESVVKEDVGEDKLDQHKEDIQNLKYWGSRN